MHHVYVQNKHKNPREDGVGNFFFGLAIDRFQWRDPTVKNVSLAHTWNGWMEAGQATSKLNAICLLTSYVSLIQSSKMWTVCDVNTSEPSNIA